MQYLLRTMCWALIVATCAGCSDRAPRESDGVAISEFPLVTFEWFRELRSARQLPELPRHVINLGAVPSQGMLRLGVLQDGNLVDEGIARVYVGRRLVKTLDFGQRRGWVDFRVDVSGGEGEDRCQIVFESTPPLWLGPCEIVDLEETAEKALPNVLVLLIDTLRLDHLGLYGYERDTSPNLDALAREGTVFTQLMPQSSWTRPSVASLLTSTYPSVHGGRTRHDKLRAGLPSLAGALEDIGYESHLLMTNPNCLPVWGFGEDFFRFIDVHSKDYQEIDVDRMALRRAKTTLELLEGKPWFMYVHIMGPHDPYEAPDEYFGRFESDTSDLNAEDEKTQIHIDRYDEEILYSDDLVGRLLDYMKKMDLYDNTTIVVLSDHGEEFMEHGARGHGKSLYEELLRVPLIIKPPLGAWTVGTRIDSLVETVDIAPTLLEISGAEVPERFQGSSFLRLLRGESLPPKTGYASLQIDRFSIRAAKRESHKFIRNLVDGTDGWYDLSKDPGEHRPVLTEPDWGIPLERLVAKRAVQGGSGLHLLITRGTERLDISATLSGENLGAPEVDSLAWENEVERSNGTVQVDLAKGNARRVHARIVESNGKVRQPYVHVRLAVEPEDLISINLSMNGEAVEREYFSAGEDRSRIGLDGAPFRVTEVEAQPDFYDLAVLPHTFGVYVWYVADTESLDDSEVPSDVLEALKALGYVD